MIIENWGLRGGKPDGWWSYQTGCGHNHGVNPTLEMLWLEIAACFARQRTEGLCPVCGGTGLTYDAVERREVPCGGLGCTVVG